MSPRRAAHATACRQGSELGPKQFLTYTEDVADLFKLLNLAHHKYADDLQTIGLRDMASTVCAFTVDVQSRCASKRLKK
jgi:hypothetical protein